MLAGVLASHLKRQEVAASFYAFRWFTTLLSREFVLPDVQRVWDSLLAEVAEERYELCSALIFHHVILGLVCGHYDINEYILPCSLSLSLI